MSYDAHPNFAYGTVVTAPSPATSGTTIVIGTSTFADFPDPSTNAYNVVIWPDGTLPLSSNAEIVRIVAKGTDGTLNIARYQENSGTRNILVGDQFAAAITGKPFTDLETTIDGKVGTADFNTHTSDATIHFTQGSISIPASQISDFDTEVSNNTDVSTNTSARHNAVTLAGTPDYLTLGTQQITLNQIDLTTDVTGVLPDANVANDITLTNITQITNRSHTSLSDIGTNSHGTIDAHIAGTSNPHSVTFSQTGAVGTTTNQTIAGTKTFDAFPITPGTAPTTDYQVSNKKYVDDSIIDGWIPSGETWTYASDDDPTFTFTISGDKTSKYTVGMKLKLTQTTVKYFIITAVSYSDPNTTVTIYGGTDYTLANATITSPYYSMVRTPQGFPTEPELWSEITTNTSNNYQASPTQNTWYNLGSISLSIPIGSWNVCYEVITDAISGASATDVTVSSTLSTSSSSESDSEFTTWTVVGGAAGTIRIGFPVFKCKNITPTSKTTYYLLLRTTRTGVTTIQTQGNIMTTRVKAICNYL